MNPCPKAHPQELLRAQFVVWNSLHSTPANRLTAIQESRSFLWWRRGELNPCPKAHPQELLRAQFVVWNSLHSTPANRLTASVESFYMTGATLNPYTFTTNRRPDPEPWSSQAGRASLIRQPVKNNRCCLIYKQLRLLRKRPHFRPLFLLQHPRRSRYVPGRASLIRQPVKNNRCCLIYKQLRLLRKRPHFRPLFLLQHPRRSRYVPV